MLPRNQAKLIIQEALRRGTLQSNKPDLFSDAFLQQRLFIEDTASRLKAAHCSRRSGKSYTAGLGLFDRALNNPAVKCFYVTVTRDMARNIMWEDVLKVIDQKHNLQCEFNETLLECRLPNRSTIRLIGVDTDEKQMRKLLGGKYKLIVLDEVAFFYTNVEEIVYKVAIPALADLKGECWLMSTSSDLCQGLFYEITKQSAGLHNGWSVHKWGWEDNPFTKDQVKAIIQELITANPLVVNTPHFKQHYLNMWTIDDANLVYKFNRQINTQSQAPKLTNYLLGVDLGYNDSTAFVVGGWNEQDKTLYIIECYKESQLDFTNVAQRIEYYCNKYNISFTVVDGANKQGIMEMQNRHNLVLESADKTSKWDFIRLMNADLVTGKIKLAGATTEQLAVEWDNLIKDPHSKTPKEHPKCENHLADAALYLWRACYNWLSEAPKQKTKLTKQQIADLEENKMFESIVEQTNEAKWEQQYFEPYDSNYLKVD